MGHERQEVLNAAQVRAVEHAGSSLIVLAGPGTGKTKVIIHRVAHLIAARGVDPTTILAVTFTVKAADQLRERLATLLGPTAAGSVRVHTFNGLGMRILQRYGDVLGLPAGLTLIDPAQAQRLVGELIRAHGLFPRSRAEGIEALSSRVVLACAGMAERGLSPEACERFGHEWADRASDEGERTAAERFRDEARAYVLYERARRARGWLNYSDQILMPLTLLREHRPEAAELRRELTHVIVDEFQDCNPAQVELLRLLAAPDPAGGREAPEVCVVGDDDQAIFGFRGADDRAFARFRRHWPGAAVVALEENYRSTAGIITVANSVISRAAERFEPDKRIVPAREGEAVWLSHDSRDGEVIAAMIAADRAARGASWGDYAVIARTHGDLDRVGAALRMEGIPHEVRREKRALDEQGVQDVRAWMRWLLDPRASWEARRVMARPPFSIPATDLIDLERAYVARRTRHESRDQDAGDPGEFAAWLLRSRGEDPVIARVVALYEGLRTQCATMRGDEAVWRIIQATDAAHAELLSGRDRARRVAALVALIGLVRDKQPRLEPPGDLRALVSHLETLESLRALAPTGSLGDVDGEVIEHEGDGQGRVHLLTAHSAKGLEFDTVFVPRVSPGHGYPHTSGGGDDRWAPPAGLVPPEDEPRPEAALEEERRLFYVACTRAQRRLVLLAKRSKGVSKSTHYLQELERETGLPLVAIDEAQALGDAERRPTVGDELSAAGLGLEGGEVARERLERLRRAMRAAAARAFEVFATAGATPEQVDRAREDLRLAADRMRGLAVLEATGELPAELRADPALTALARAGEATNAGLLRPIPAPLTLSYSAVEAYHRCARCWYLKSRMGLVEAARRETGVGEVAHVVLQAFFLRVRDAEADGRPVPGMDDLAAMARREYLRALGPDEPAREQTVEQLVAQLRHALETLHDPQAQILEIERKIDFPYELDGVAHSFTAKIDRIDLMPDGTHRIIDYKTGQPWKSLTSPKADDLQMGVYAMALTAFMGGQMPAGTAEYWLLATGQRGVLPFDQVKLDKVRTKIDQAARGMLQGLFPRDPACTGPCTLLADE
jgi:DNA helicase II / ATP-dependent DNA helicase PcrA